MQNISQPPRQEEPVMTDADLAALLAGTADSAPGLRPVADVLAALTAEPTGAELAGEASALAEFRRRAAVPVPASRARRSTTGRRSRFGVKVGASVTAVAVVLGGGAAAAFAGVLPAPIQRLAHYAIGAPTPPRPGPAHRGRPGTPGRAVPGQAAEHGRPAGRGGPDAQQGRPHATPAQAAQGKGTQGRPGQVGGQGHKGSGQGNGNGQGQGSKQRQGKDRQGVGSPAPRQQGNLHKKGPNASSQINRRPAGTRAGPSVAGRS